MKRFLASCLLVGFLLPQGVVGVEVEEAPLELEAVESSGIHGSLEEYFVMDGTTLKEYIGTGGDVVIPSVVNGVTVKKIDGLAFWQAPVTSVVIPSSVNTICGWAFYDCNTLERLVIEEGVTKIEEVAFYYCENLVEVQLPQSLTKIEDEAFAYCTSLEEIVLPSSLTSLEYGVFHGCSSLKSIVIPDSVSYLGDWVFYNCSNLSKVTLSESLSTIEEGTFARCTSLAELRIPEGVTTINDMAFLGCGALRQVFFPSTVTRMGEYLFVEAESIIYPEEFDTVIPVFLWGYKDTAVEPYSMGHGFTFIEQAKTRSLVEYEDVTGLEWFLPGMTFVTQYQLMPEVVGEEGLLFEANSGATRAVTAEVFALFSGETLGEGASGFTDVSEETSLFVQWCVENAVMSGYSEDVFGAEDFLTREQFATILAGYAKYQGSYQAVEFSSLDSYVDKEEISSYALEPMAWAVEQGLMMGYEMALNPQKTVTRGEVATVILAFYGTF